MAATITLLIARTARPDPLHEFAVPEWQPYVHEAPALELLLPYRFELHPGTRPGEVFSASYAGRFPSIALSVTPASRDLQQRVQAAVEELGPTARVESRRGDTVNGVPALIAFVRWTLPEGAGVELQTLFVCVQAGEQTVLVSATDGAPDTGFDEELAHSALSLRLGATAAGVDVADRQDSSHAAKPPL